jgi:hypothetical protein
MDDPKEGYMDVDKYIKWWRKYQEPIYDARDKANAERYEREEIELAEELKQI